MLDKKHKDNDIVRARVSIKSVKSLLGKAYLMDEIIDYCLRHLGTLFCGDVSPYSTFIFPHNFTTRLTNLGHLTIEGALDIKKGVKIAVKLSHGKDLMDYDHLIVYCNPGKNHWNMVVVFPKEKKIEMFDSIGVYDTSPLIAEWHFLVAYCIRTSTFDPTGWKLYHSRPGVSKQADGYNCGLFVILYSVAIHHQNDLNKITSDNCNQLRRYLTYHFMRDATDGQRLTQAWNKDYPVPHSTPKPALVASSEQGLPKKTTPVVTQLDEPQSVSSQDELPGSGEGDDQKEDEKEDDVHNSDKMDVEVPEVENNRMDVDEEAIQSAQPRDLGEPMVITHNELSDEINSHEEYMCIIEELNLPKESKD